MKLSAFRNSMAAVPALSLALLAASPEAAWSQAFPNRPVHLITPYSPGPSDVITRMISERLSGRWGQPVLLENRPGAYFINGVQAVLRAPADGHTIYLMSGGDVVNLVLYKLPYDFSDLTAIVQTSYVPQILMANAATGIKSFPELVAYSKTKPGGVNWGTLGTTIELMLVGLAKQTGVVYTKIAYKGVSDANTAVASGQVDVLIGPPAAGFLKEGKVRFIGATPAKRMKDYPDVPSISEFAPGWYFQGWNGIAASSKTPRPLLELWNKEWRESVNQPAVTKAYENLGYIVGPTTLDETAEVVRREYQMYLDYAREGGIVKKDP